VLKTNFRPLSFSYTGLIPAKLNKEIYSLLEACRIENIKEKYPVYTHVGFLNVKIHFNGIHRITKGNYFPEELQNLLKTLYEIERSDLY